MKILHVVSTYPPYRGGMGTVAHEEAVRLAAMGHEVHVATLLTKASRRRWDSDGVTVHRCRAECRMARLAVAIVRLMMRSGMPCICTRHFWCAACIVLCWFGWRPKNLVVTYHMDIVAHGFVKMVAWVRDGFLGDDGAPSGR